MAGELESRISIWPRVLSGLVPLVLAGGLAGWWFVGREPGYYLQTSDARGIQPGDPVVRSGVRIGQVVGVKGSDAGAQVEFRLEGDEVLLLQDLVRIHRGLMSATAEVQLTRGCQSPPDGSGAVAVPRGRVLEEAGRVTVMATEARCSNVAQRIEEWLQDVDLERAVGAFQRAVDETKQLGAEAMQEGAEFLREQGEDLALKLEASGLSAKADSVRQVMRDRLLGR